MGPPTDSPPSPPTHTLTPQSELEEAFKRISSHKGVLGAIITNKDGIPIRTSLDYSKDATAQHAALITPFVTKARDVVRKLLPLKPGAAAGTDELTFLRIRSKKNEILGGSLFPPRAREAGEDAPPRATHLELSARRRQPRE